MRTRWNVAKIRTTKEELLVEVCQKDAKMLDFLANYHVLEPYPRGVSAMFVTRNLEIEAPVMVLLMVLLAGIHIIALNGKCWLTIGFERIGVTDGSGMILIDDIRLYAPLNK